MDTKHSMTTVALRRTIDTHAHSRKQLHPTTRDCSMRDSIPLDKNMSSKVRGDYSSLWCIRKVDQRFCLNKVTMHNYPCGTTTKKISCLKTKSALKDVLCWFIFSVVIELHFFYLLCSLFISTISLFIIPLYCFLTLLHFHYQVIQSIYLNLV